MSAIAVYIALLSETGAVGACEQPLKHVQRGRFRTARCDQRSTSTAYVHDYVAMGRLCMPGPAHPGIHIPPVEEGILRENPVRG
jgi:hypothetical protein